MLAARSRKARTNSRGKASREQILGAAVDLLQEHGYAGLSIAGICERADISPTSIYWHFGNKAGLMEAVIGRIGSGYLDRIRASLAGVRNPLERLDRVIAGIRELVTTQPLGSLTGVAIVGEGRHVTPELRAALKRAREQELAVLVEDFQAELGVPTATADALAVISLACANYAALSYRIDQDLAQVDRILAGYREAVLQMARSSSPAQA